jgi:hypothetical protein
LPSESIFEHVKNIFLNAACFLFCVFPVATDILAEMQAITYIRRLNLLAFLPFPLAGEGQGKRAFVVEKYRGRQAFSAPS